MMFILLIWKGFRTFPDISKHKRFNETKIDHEIKGTQFPSRLSLNRPNHTFYSKLTSQTEITIWDWPAFFINFPIKTTKRHKQINFPYPLSIEWLASYAAPTLNHKYISLSGIYHLESFIITLLYIIYVFFALRIFLWA